MGEANFTTLNEVYTRASNAERIKERRKATEKMKAPTKESTQQLDKVNNFSQNKSINFDNRGPKGNFSRGGQSYQASRSAQRRDCEGNKVTCNYCKKEGHRAYECFINPNAKIGRTCEVLRKPTASTASNRPTTSAAPNHTVGMTNVAHAKRGPEKKNTGNLNHLKQADATNQGNALIEVKLANIFVPSGLSVTCNKMHLDVPIAYGKTTLFANLIVFPLKDFDVILGMDWLEKYKAKIDCPKQKVTIKSHKGVHVLYSHRPVKIISAFTLKSYLRLGCPVYLCHIHDTSKERTQLVDVPVVNEYQDVFPDDILNMPPKRDVEFNIDLNLERDLYLSHLIGWRLLR
ncbi:uncharacterized protein LOC109133652 [Beta vulgaris subsp. vulgaris]|uniref:uncharacterized protein LOC109133652 n=1 Tax=Beta vulgaris subsp. vulgaris TaxID=3555 RepID=UPI0009006897|nr:uncharacterized protein LOC109133652 [Beta vulgaris subsp. vulgaris]